MSASRIDYLLRQNLGRKMKFKELKTIPYFVMDLRIDFVSFSAALNKTLQVADIERVSVRL